eukprot:2031601-Prymnesium_polylepis.1
MIGSCLMRTAGLGSSRWLLAATVTAVDAASRLTRVGCDGGAGGLTSASGCRGRAIGSARLQLFSSSSRSERVQET